MKLIYCPFKPPVGPNQVLIIVYKPVLIAELMLDEMIESIAGESG